MPEKRTAIILTRPEGMLRRVAVLESKPKPRINMLEKVLIVAAPDR
jgi:hypothetical protein